MNHRIIDITSNYIATVVDCSVMQVRLTSNVSDPIFTIMKRDDATDMIGIEYHESEITKQIKVNLLKIKEGAAPGEPY